MKDQISVIVPVYNVQSYLNRCMNSVIQQEYSNTQIILVDDGSNDGSGLLCDKYILQDERIIVIHKNNGGLSDARNKGIKCASGEFLSFVDSDDWIDKHFLSYLKCTMDRTYSDVVECLYDKTSIEKSINVTPFSQINTVTFHDNYIFFQYLEQNFHGIVWNKLYRKDLVKDVFFDVGRYYEDEFWTYKIFGKAKCASIIDYCGYHYFQRPDSIMGTNMNIKKIRDMADCKIERTRYIDTHFPEFKQLWYKQFLFSFIGIYKKLKDVHEKSEVKRMKRWIKDCYYNAYKAYKRTIPWKTRFRLVAFLLMPDVYCAICFK